MNLSKSPYIDLIIDIGHLFPKIVLFRYNRIGVSTQTHDLLFKFTARENRANEADDGRRVVCGGLMRRKEKSRVILRRIRCVSHTISNSKTAFQRKAGYFGLVADQFVDSSGCRRLWDRCYRSDP
ncbi:MAG TPA: hypothetical protein DD662_07885 [Planctomycetaceae bacterium]|nr:hypothetical protein [Planctomycetaceae bacterium]